MSHIFDCPDGTLIEVKSKNARRWRSDSCDCVLVLELRTLELDFAVEVCELHKSISDSQLVSKVLAHNNAINSKFGVGIEPTLTQKAEMASDRKAEKARIAGLAKPQIRADKTTKDTIETDLRSKGR